MTLTPVPNWRRTLGCRKYEKRLEWREQLWDPFRAGLADVGFNWDALLDCFPVARRSARGSGSGRGSDSNIALEGLIEGRGAEVRCSELDANSE